MDKQFNKLTKNIQALTTQAYNDYKPLVDGVFANQLTNQKEIENILGYILDFCYDPKMLQLYKSLCRYYWDSNPRVTADYIKYYREMWDSDED